MGKGCVDPAGLVSAPARVGSRRLRRAVPWCWLSVRLLLFLLFDQLRLRHHSRVLLQNSLHYREQYCHESTAAAVAAVLVPAPAAAFVGLAVLLHSTLCLIGERLFLRREQRLHEACTSFSRSMRASSVGLSVRILMPLSVLLPRPPVRRPRGLSFG